MLSRGSTGLSPGLGSNASAGGAGRRCAGWRLASRQASPGRGRGPRPSRAGNTRCATGVGRSALHWRAVMTGWASCCSTCASRPLGLRSSGTCLSAAGRGTHGFRTCSAVRPPRARGLTRGQQGGGDRWGSGTRRRLGPSAKGGWGRWPPWGGRVRRRCWRGNEPRMAETFPAWRVGGEGCPHPAGGGSAMARGAPGQPARTGWGTTPFPGRRCLEQGRRLRPWPPGAQRG